MRLSELHTGETAVIVKVYGHGGFRKRIMEMGFVKGKEITALEDAPLRDPVKYLIMGYEISLRREEADHIQVVTMAEALRSRALADSATDFSCPCKDDDEIMTAAVQKRRHHINVALVGNPNCGKTSLFNFVSGARERVGNYFLQRVGGERINTRQVGDDYVLVTF